MDGPGAGSRVCSEQARVCAKGPAEGTTGPLLSSSSLGKPRYLPVRGSPDLPKASRLRVGPGTGLGGKEGNVPLLVLFPAVCPPLTAG